MAVSLEHLGNTNNNSKAKVLAKTLDEATDKFLDNKKSPSRKAGELDNRGSHFYLALYWALALANQGQDQELKTQFTIIAKQLGDNEQPIINELNSIQGNALNIGGYYQPDNDLTRNAMRPSETFNAILNTI